MTLAFLCGLEWALYLPPPRLAHQLEEEDELGGTSDVLPQYPGGGVSFSLG